MHQQWLKKDLRSGPLMAAEDGGESRIYIRVGDIEIDIAGAQSDVDARILKFRKGESWSEAIAKVRQARELAIAAAVEAARRSGLPERGSAFATLIENCNLVKKPDQVLAAIHYLRDVEGVNDSPPRVLSQIFDDAGLPTPGNLSLYLNRLRERGFIAIPPSAHEKNRYAILTPEGRAHLDKRSNA